MNPQEQPPAVTHRRPLSHRDVLAIAVPITISNATVPLIGFADTAVIGQLGEAHLLGAVALAANLFNFLYFVFGFLRMGTTGLTAQAVGADDNSEVGANLLRALLAAAILGLGIVILQTPVIQLSLAGFGPSARVSEVAKLYFDIRVWGAPAALANFALIGWFIGLGKASITFYLQLLLNCLNIGLAIVFVMVLDWGVGGVAAAALIAEYVAAAVGIAVAWRVLRWRGRWFVGRGRTGLDSGIPKDARSGFGGREVVDCNKHEQAGLSWGTVFEMSKLRKLFAVSRDIMIRTLCIQAAFVFFVAQGARTDDLTLAANAVLYSMMMISIYMIDGFAFAAEALVGQAIGAQRRDRFRQAVKLTTVWAFGLSVVLSIGLWVGGGWIINFVSTNDAVRQTSRVFLIWTALVPMTSVWCFQLDGIFIGATDTETMRNMMLWAIAVYFAAWLALYPMFGNHGLWIAMHVFFLARAVALSSQMPALERKSFGGSSRVEI